MSPLKFIKKIHNYEISLDEAIEDQKKKKLKILINKLDNDYNPRISKKLDEKNRVLESAKNLSDARDEIINLFEKGTFPYKGNDNYNPNKRKEEKSEDESREESEKQRTKKFTKYIENESKSINYDLFKKYFRFVTPSALLKQLYEKKYIEKQ